MAAVKRVRIIKKILEASGQWRFVSLKRAGTRYAWDDRPDSYFVEWWEGRKRPARRDKSSPLAARRRPRSSGISRRTFMSFFF